MSSTASGEVRSSKKWRWWRSLVWVLLVPLTLIHLIVLSSLVFGAEESGTAIGNALAWLYLRLGFG